jgi:hypothetical protein
MYGHMVMTLDEFMEGLIQAIEKWTPEEKAAARKTLDEKLGPRNWIQ